MIGNFDHCTGRNTLGGSDVRTVDPGVSGLYAGDAARGECDCGQGLAELRSTWTGLATIFTRAVSTGAEREDFFGMKRCYMV